MPISKKTIPNVNPILVRTYVISHINFPTNLHMYTSTMHSHDFDGDNSLSIVEYRIPNYRLL